MFFLDKCLPIQIQLARPDQLGRASITGGKGNAVQKDNGNPLGTCNCDNADRVVAFSDGSFVVSTVYDEAGIPLRYYAASGQTLSGSALAEKDIWAIAAE